MYVCECACVSVCIYVMCVFMCLCIYVYVYICARVRACVRTCIHARVCLCSSSTIACFSCPPPNRISVSNVDLNELSAFI